MSSFFYSLRKWKRYSRFIYFSIISKLYLSVQGIKIGKKVTFNGFSYFSRYPSSTIIIGDNCRFNSSTTSNLIGVNHKCMISTNSKNAVLEIGEGCGFSGVTIGCFANIKLGNKVRCGANVLITDSDWHLDDPRVGEPKPIIIEDNVWLGYGVVVMKGVRIGENSVIGINSIVVKDIPKNVIAAGNPCKIVKQFSINLERNLPNKLNPAK